MADPLATLADVEAMYGTLSPQETSMAEFLLGYGSARIRAEVATIDARIESGELDPDLPAGMLTLLVVDVLNNPVGFESETINDATYRHGKEALKNRMTPSAEDLASLMPPSRKVRTRTIQLGKWC